MQYNDAQPKSLYAYKSKTHPNLSEKKKKFRTRNRGMSVIESLPTQRALIKKNDRIYSGINCKKNILGNTFTHYKILTQQITPRPCWC